MLKKETKNNLLELRTRLIYCLCIYFVLFCILFYASHYIFNLLSEPLLRFLPSNSSLIASSVISPVIMPVKLSMNLSFILTLPVIFYNLWKFIAPGLYPQEKVYVIPMVITSLILFSFGVIFSYYIVLPLMFSVFVNWLPTDVAIMTDINNYLDFVFNMFLIFGIIFEIPLAILVLIKLNIITTNQLRDIRPYFVILAFIISMLLTPPDVISMIILAVPICVLYEMGLLLAKLCERQNKKHSVQSID